MIVVTNDGSERARHAIPHASRFARATGRKLAILRVIDLEEEGDMEAAGWPRRVRTRVDRATEALRTVAAAEGVDADALVGITYRGESTARAILRTAEDAGATLIAIDSRGHSALRHVLLGSVAMEVLAGAEVPLMVTGPAVQPPLAGEAYRVLVTSDGSPASARVLAALQPFLDRVRVDLLSVYVPTLGDAGEAAEVAMAYERLLELQKGFGPSADRETIVRRAAGFQKPHTLAIETAREVGANALAMSTHGHSAPHHALIGSFAADCVRESPVPVILTRRTA